MKHKAIFAGSFDPISLAHINILEKANKLFEKVYVCISKNISKKPFFSTEERFKIAKASLKKFDNIEIIAAKNKLTATIAKEVGAVFLIRGLRSDQFFVNEYELAGINNSINPELETLIFFTSPRCGLISSTVIRELLSRNLAIDKYVDFNAIDVINNIMRNWNEK